MNQLAIVILSKQLKYSLASQKIKTLQKAIELLPKFTQTQQPKKKTITNLANKYNRIKQSVINQFAKFNPIHNNINNIQTHQNINNINNNNINIKGQSTQQLIIKPPSSINYQFLLNKCMCQIYGPKGSGKTSLLLHFAQQYGNFYKTHKKNTKIIIFNCVSGITNKRMQKLQKMRDQGMSIQCLQINSIQQIIKIVNKIKVQLQPTTTTTTTSTTTFTTTSQQKQQKPKHIFIGIDMMLMLLIPKQKPKLLLNKLYKLLDQLINKDIVSVVFTNLIQHKYQLGNQDIYNHASYYCQSTAEYTTHKLYLQRVDKNLGNKFRLLNIKGNKIQGGFTIQQTGIIDIKIRSKLSILTQTQQANNQQHHIDQQ